MSTLQARPAGIKNGHPHIWCPGCDESCQFGPCCAPETSAPAVDNGLTIKLDVGTVEPNNKAMDSWRFEALEEQIMGQHHPETTKIYYMHNSVEPWRIEWGYGPIVHGRSLREAVDFYITALRDLAAKYDEEEEEHGEYCECDDCCDDPDEEPF